MRDIILKFCFVVLANLLCGLVYAQNVKLSAKPVAKKVILAKTAEKKVVLAKPMDKKVVLAKLEAKKIIPAKPVEKKVIPAKPIVKKAPLVKPLVNKVIPAKQIVQKIVTPPAQTQPTNVIAAIENTTPIVAVSNTISVPTAAPKFSIKNPTVVLKLEDSLKKQFEKQKLTWPPQGMYLRSFKYEKELEVWVQTNSKEGYKLFKSYKVCQQSGTMGPKRAEGDYQVPEGFYYINEFNPNSHYHLALGLNYPNASDRILADQYKPGSAIYIHGNCVSTGCIPLTDAPMEELYQLATVVNTAGQEFIPVHVFPIRYNVKKSTEFLETLTKENEALKAFNVNIKLVYDYFEIKKELPIIMVNTKGEYVLN